jgi:hypothetical protein
MAEIQAGTIFSAIAPNTNTNRRSAIVNRHTLVYTIEDIAAAVGGDVDLSAYLTIADAEDTYQPLSGMSSYLTSADAMGIYQPISGMSSYLTTANAASTYQTLIPNKIADSITGVTSNVTSGNIVNANQGIVLPNLGNVTSQTGTIIVRMGNAVSWAVGGYVSFPVENSYITNNTRVFLSPKGPAFAGQMVSAYHYYQSPGYFEVLLKTVGTLGYGPNEELKVDYFILF